MYGSATMTRSATSTCTASRVDAVLDVFFGDAIALCCRDFLSKDRLKKWGSDLVAVLLLEAVERFQIKLTLPSGEKLALDYTVSDDGSAVGADGCGGFSVHWLPAGTQVSLVISWRANAPKLAQAQKVLNDRGWGPATMLDATGATERTYSKDGYALQRRMVGSWQV